jgi:membrane associated rhomboid family serine protease
MPTMLTFGLILACLIVFVIQSFTGPAAIASPLVKWGLLTYYDGKCWTQPWRWITYQYLHGSGSHIFFNLITIYFFVPALERMWGWQRTLAFYTLGGILAGLTFGVVQMFFAPGMSLIGASGAILAVIGALAALTPDAQVFLIIIPMTMRVMALLFGILYLLTVIGDRSPADGAHLGGLVLGWALARYGGGIWRKMFPQWAVGGGFSAEEEAEPRENARETRRVAKAAKIAEKLRREEAAEQAEIDEILAKVSAHGMQSLTNAEKKALQRATERQRARDAEFTKLRRRT